MWQRTPSSSFSRPARRTPAASWRQRWWRSQFRTTCVRASPPLSAPKPGSRRVRTAGQSRAATRSRTSAWRPTRSPSGRSKSNGGSRRGPPKRPSSATPGSLGRGYTPAMAACSTCGARNPGRARFCHNCGKRLAEQRAAESESRRTVTVLFADIVGSTALGEAADAEVVRSAVGQAFAAMRGTIERHGGTVEKFVGDAVMAIFGLPTLHEDDALRAARAAAELEEELAMLKEELEPRLGRELSLRVGLSTGEVVAGDPSRGETLATGDTVNTAARLEQAANPGEILLGPVTARLVRGAARLQAVPPIAAKGKAEPIPAFRLVSIGSSPPAPPTCHLLDARLNSQASGRNSSAWSPSARLRSSRSW